MATPLIDFSHFTPEQRIELAEQLRESLDPSTIGSAGADAELLPLRRAELAGDNSGVEEARRMTSRLFVRRVAKTDVAAAFELIAHFARFV